MKKKLLRIIAGLLGVIILLSSMITAISFSRNNVSEKTIYAEVVDINGKSSSYMLKTDAKYLKDALLSGGFASGKTTEDGFILQSLGTITLNDNQKFTLYTEEKRVPKTLDRVEIISGTQYKFAVENK